MEEPFCCHHLAAAAQVVVVPCHCCHLAAAEAAAAETSLPCRQAEAAAVEVSCLRLAVAEVPVDPPFRPLVMAAVAVALCHQAVAAVWADPLCRRQAAEAEVAARQELRVPTLAMGARAVGLRRCAMQRARHQQLLLLLRLRQPAPLRHQDHRRPRAPAGLARSPHQS